MRPIHLLYPAAKGKTRVHSISAVPRAPVAGTADDEPLKSEERHRALTEASRHPVLVVQDLRLVYANPAAILFLGAATRNDLVGRSVLDFLPADGHDRARSWFDARLASDEPPLPIEHPVVRLDGRTIQAETVVVRTTFGGGGALHAVVRDLTARCAADDETMRYRAIAENTEEIVYFTSPDGRIVDCNRAATTAYGYSREELVGKSVLDLRPAESDQLPAVQLTKAPGDAAMFEMAHVRKDGSRMDLSVRARRILVGAEELVVSTCRDITTRREAERDLRLSEERYRSLIELSPSPIAVCDANRTVILANAATLRLLRAVSAEDVIGRDLTEFIDPRDHDETVRRALQPRPADTDPFVEVEMVRVDGSPVATEIAVNPTSFGGEDGLQLVIQDVTRLKDAAETLKRTTEDTITAMARLAETRDPYTSGHQERVSVIACLIAHRLGLPETVCEMVRLSGIVHDIGKMNVPSEILSKPGTLTDAELELVQTHAERGYELLAPIEFPWPIADVVRQHHERLDGSGYPLGLRGDDIRIEARVLAVADVVEAISSDRPYRPALGFAHALSVVTEGRGTLYDPDCVDACVSLADTGELAVCEGLLSEALRTAGPTQPAARR